MKVHADFQTFASVHFDPTKYIASPLLGVNRFLLDRIGHEMARATSIVQYQPNSHFPEHTHVGGEEYLVLSGTFHDASGAYPAGAYVRNPIGSKHAPWVNDDGCVILVKLLQMAETETEEQALHVNVHLDNNHNNRYNKYKPTDYGSVLDLYHNARTGERVHMCWIQPNAVFVSDDDHDDDDTTGGVELFVYEGSLLKTKCHNNNNNSNNNNNNNNDNDNDSEAEEYGKWAWLRFPPAHLGPSSSADTDDGTLPTTTTTSSSKRTTLPLRLQAGSRGAHVYKKTGHLTRRALAMEKIQMDPETEQVIVPSTTVPP